MQVGVARRAAVQRSIVLHELVAVREGPVGAGARRWRPVFTSPLVEGHFGGGDGVEQPVTIEIDGASAGQIHGESLHRRQRAVAIAAKQSAVAREDVEMSVVV